MPKRVPLVEHAIEVQVAIRELRSATHPLYEAAVASGDWSVLSETKALAATLKVAAAQARRIAGLAETACPDGKAEIGHGLAA